MKSGLTAIVNVNLEIKIPENCENIIEFVESQELPTNYVEDSFEMLKTIDENGDNWDYNCVNPKEIR